MTRESVRNVTISLSKWVPLPLEQVLPGKRG